MPLELCACAQRNNNVVENLAFTFVNLRSMLRGKKRTFYLNLTMIISQSFPYFPSFRKAKTMPVKSPMTVPSIRDLTIVVNISKQTALQCSCNRNNKDSILVFGFC